jgi:dolichyl-phosphate-mannose-protein mannosyltransferase
MTGRGAAYALLALAVLLHALLLWRMGAHQVDLDHDSTISYLAATGHQGEYARLHLNAWTPARAIQRLFQIDQVWPLRRIRDDLALTDIHPPLYFWLLHAQLLASGATLWAFLVLNGLIGALTMLAIYSIGRRLWDRESAAGAALLWSVCYGALLTAGDARPYALLALLSLLTVRLVLSVRDRGGRPSIAQAALLVLVMMLGLLTHYHFPLVLVAVGVGLLCSGDRGSRGQLVTLVPLAVLALGGLALVHPGFITSLQRQRLQTQPNAGEDLPERLRQFTLGLEGLARPSYALPLLSWACVLLLAWVAWRAYRAGAFGRLSGAWGHPREASPGIRLIAWTALAYTVVEGLLFVGRLSPAHAAGGRYDAALWPLLALLVTGAVRALSPGRSTMPLLAIATALLTWQSASELDASQVRLVRSPAWQALKSARLVVADHDQRGLLPRCVLHVPADAPVCVVFDPAALDSLLPAHSVSGFPVTFLLSSEFGDPRMRQALENAALAGDSVVSKGYGPAGTEVLMWTPSGVRTGAAAGR